MFRKQSKNKQLAICPSKKIGQHRLIFVHRTCILLQRGKVVAADALLGRFLPRLGPLVTTQAASFFTSSLSLGRWLS